MYNIHRHNQLTHMVNKVTSKKLLCIPVSSLAIPATSLNYFPSTIRPPCVDPQSTSASSNDYSYFVWIAIAFAGGLALLAVGICTIAAIILIRKRLKQRRRNWLILQSPHPNVTSQQEQPAGSTSGLAATACPLSSIQQVAPPFSEEGEKEEEDNHCDNDADRMNSLLMESGDEQPLLP